MELSNYAIALKHENIEEFNRYLQKIKVIKYFDPYFHLKILNDCDSSLNWYDTNNSLVPVPNVTFLDVYNYFVLKKSAYTFEQFKSHKALQAFNFFISGHVRFVKWLVRENIYVVLGQVAHSFSVGAPNLSAWLLIKKDGEILTAHCSCVAGKGECCSHCAAICFYLEFYNKKQSEGSSTVDPAYWVQPVQSKKLTLSPKRIGEVSFITAKRLRQHFDSPDQPLTLKTDDIKSVRDACKSSELVPFLTKYKLASSTPLLRVISPFREEIQKSLEKPPLSYRSLYDENLESLTLRELLVKAKEIDLTLTPHQREEVETKTRRQSQSRLWFMYRAGRITGSNIRQVCFTKSYSSSISLLKRICYPANNNFRADAVEWGCKHEKDAINAFRSHFSSHTDVEIRQCGLYIHAQFPFIAATPDSIITCSCCGTGVLEVKCPFCLNTKSMEEIQWLDSDNGRLSLRKDHSYYYQIQTQIFCANSLFAEFVVWSPDNNHHYERILPDKTLFFNVIVPKCAAYFENAVLPQLLARYYTNIAELKRTNMENENDKENDMNQENLAICICRPNIKAKRTIICTQDGCDVVKYHFKCVGINRFQKNWICDSCKLRS